MTSEDYCCQLANKIGNKLAQMDKYDANGELTPEAERLIYLKALAVGRWEEEAWKREQETLRRR